MKWLALAAIRLYQRTISRVMPPSCRFVPSCSEYGYEAIARYGMLRGGVLAAWRVMRCNPWGGHGYDPVPTLTERQARGTPKHESRDDAQEDDISSSLSTPHSYHDFALTPHAPGHSLTEGLP